MNGIERKILRRAEVIARTGLPRSTIYLKMKMGAFPWRVKLGPHSVGWYEDEIQDWIEAPTEYSSAQGGDKLRS